MTQAPPPKEYWECRLRENFDLHGTGFITFGKNYNNWMYKIRRRVILSRMKSKHINLHGSNVLDVGSGTGFYVDMWKCLGVKSVVGIDITDIAVENLKQKYPDENFFRIDIGDEDMRDLKKTKYNIISAFDVLFHIVDDNRYNQAIKNISSLMKPNGIFIFSDNFLHTNVLRYIYQVSRPLQEIEKVISQNSLEILERSPMFAIMSAPVDTSNTLFKLSWKVISYIVQCSNIVGFLIGALLYPLELLLVSFMTEGPTTEVMICRKRPE